MPKTPFYYRLQQLTDLNHFLLAHDQPPCSSMAGGARVNLSPMLPGRKLGPALLFAGWHSGVPLRQLEQGLPPFDGYSDGLQCFDAMRSMAARLRSTSASVVAQDETLMRIAVRPCQIVLPHQHVPSDWSSAMTRPVVAASPKATRT